MDVQIEGVEDNIINLSAHASRLRAQLLSQDVGSALSELEELRTTVIRLAALLQFAQLAGHPLAQANTIYATLDQLVGTLKDVSSQLVPRSLADQDPTFDKE